MVSGNQISEKQIRKRKESRQNSFLNDRKSKFSIYCQNGVLKLHMSGVIWRHLTSLVRTRPGLGFTLVPGYFSWTRNPGPALENSGPVGSKCSPFFGQISAVILRKHHPEPKNFNPPLHHFQRAHLFSCVTLDLPAIYQPNQRRNVPQHFQIGPGSSPMRGPGPGLFLKS